MSIIVGFTKMTYFAKPANLARTEKMKQQNRHIDSWRFTQKWQIWETGELGKNPSTVWQNLKWGDKKGRFRQIWRVCQKNHQGFGQIFKWDDKKGHALWPAIFRTMTNFAKMANLSRSYQRFDKNLQRDDKRGHLDKWRL